jgi:hypothetical protein
VSDPIDDQLRAHPCPRCAEVGTLRLVTRLITRPPGDWSLAGYQVKLPATEWPHVVCTADDCDFVKRARRVE